MKSGRAGQEQVESLESLRPELELNRMVIITRHGSWAKDFEGIFCFSGCGLLRIFVQE